MTPEHLKALFDGQGILIVFVWGLLCKYTPPLARVPNQLIPWIGAILYCLQKLAGPALVAAAHAGVGGQLKDAIPNLASVLIGAFTSAVWARQLYEGFGRHALEQWLKVKKPVTG